MVNGCGGGCVDECARRVDHQMWGTSHHESREARGSNSELWRPMRNFLGVPISDATGFLLALHSKISTGGAWGTQELKLGKPCAK